MVIFHLHLHSPFLLGPWRLICKASDDVLLSLWLLTGSGQGDISPLLSHCRGGRSSAGADTDSIPTAPVMWPPSSTLRGLGPFKPGAWLSHMVSLATGHVTNSGCFP